MSNATATEREVIEVDAQGFINALYMRKGCAICFIDAEYNMDEVDSKGQLKRMKKRNNPFLGQNIIKKAVTEMLLTFHYDKSMEKRTGEAYVAGTSWHQPLLRTDGTLTPFAIHKADVRPDGSPILGARIYLRGEFRSSESVYLDRNGNEVNKEILKPYLKEHGETGPVDFHLVGLENVRAVRIDGVEYRLIKPANISGYGQVNPVNA
jgi:hypothetical protein